ncbi:MAG: YihA family ribosome biogenesis GTP-binding protein [Magnetococcales bacterium]|nr:YihA family ribosome biogenesis GTP-binding protein [Magnetococcales bacterium]
MEPSQSTASDQAESITTYLAEFITGAVKPSGFPPDDKPETAFAGRSNVGKSSLLNRLLNRKKLARVSRTPGRTREINFFLVDQRWSFVDLPGYGFAKIAKQKREIWDQSIGGYFSSRRNLRGVMLLLDLRRGITDLDRAMMVHLADQGLSYVPVATKIDKLRSNARRQALVTLTKEIKTTPGFPILPVVPVSALTGDGLPQLWLRLEQLLAVTPELPTPDSEPALLEPKES